MKRKVIQIAESTQLVSLPRQWAKKYEIKKGDELEVTMKGNKLEIASDTSAHVQTENLDISNLSPMISRWIHAMYKRGVDEIRVTYDDEKLTKEVYQAIEKETVGYEVIDQSKGRCTVKFVTGELGDFNGILRRTFLVMLNMAEETYEAISTGEFETLSNIAYLEEANNRFTTVCRRLLNKKGGNIDVSMGAQYYIIEDLENIADYYKYLCNYLAEKDSSKVKISAEALRTLKKTNEALKLFYETYYKFNKDNIVKIGELRKEVIETGIKVMEEKKGADVVVVHHSITIMQKIFCLVGPYLVINV
jgi:phosphate uptake regulator